MYTRERLSVRPVRRLTTEAIEREVGVLEKASGAIDSVRTTR